MKSLCLSGVISASGIGFCRPITESKICFPRSPVSLSSINFRFRSQNVVKVHKRHTLSIIFASNPNLSGQEETDGAKSSDAANGPPFLTILAGILVFLLIIWIVGSVLLWLIGLIVKVPPVK